jgi:hypothetical protein
MATNKSKLSEMMGDESDEPQSIVPYVPEETAVEASSVMGNFLASPNLGASDISWPQMKLGQGTTPEVQDGNARQGQWIITGFSEAYDSVYVIPLMMSKPRELRWPDDGSPTANRIRCASTDSITGVGDNGQSEGEHACEGCPMSQWIPRENQKTNAPPPCQQIYRYLMALVDDPMAVDPVIDIVLYSAKGTAIRPAQRMNTFFVTKGGGRFMVKLSSAKQSGQRGIFFVPTVGIVTQVRPEILEAARSLMSAV